MIEFKRSKYLQKLVSHKHNHLVKIVTGVRRCGKSYLLFNLFKHHLLDSGVDASHIIEIVFDDRRSRSLRNPDACIEYVTSLIKDDQMYYVLLDEVQLMDDFEDALLTFLHISNLDTYATGSNSRFLSSDVITEFRDRGDEIHIAPLSFSEYANAFPDKPWNDLWEEYYNYGGMPYAALLPSPEEKEDYLKQLFERTYIKDIVERNNMQEKQPMEQLVNIIASSVGAPTNPLKLEKSFLSMGKTKLSHVTISQYLDYLRDAFLVEKSVRYDIKGKKYISTPAKYYFVDMGLRNARLNFRQNEENHIMENVIYNELRMRGFTVDVGMVEIKEKQPDGTWQRKQLEIDFVANKGSRRYYIQSAFMMPDEEKRQKEERPLLRVDDSFKKIIVVRDNIILRRDDNGLVTIGLRQFLLDENSLDL
ncbi:MAG: ATP-binding protein [Bacteroidales bacterium]|nr:ATP-binding protein [Bacteroidales bacterium]